MDKADNLWDANQATQVAISSVSATPSVSSPVTTGTESQPEVAAIARGRANLRNRGVRNRGGRGRGRGGTQAQPQNQNQPDPRGKRHESNPPWNSCKAHWLHAENAWQCQSPTTCPLKNKITPKSSN